MSNLRKIHKISMNLAVLSVIFMMLVNGNFLTQTSNSTEITQEKHLNPNQSAMSYDNQTHRYLFTFPHELNQTILNTFTSFDGEIIGGPWESLYSFAGIINNTENRLGAYVSAIGDVEIFDDPILKTQMNTVHHQLQTYPGVISESYYNFQGDPNSSLAILDTGIDSSNNMFNGSYGDQDFSQKIIGWKDFITDSSTPSDIHGHGTSLASIAVGGGNYTLEPQHENNALLMTVGGNYSHFDLFYPNHVQPTQYKIKLATLNISNSESIVSINGSLIETTINQFSEYQLALVQNGVIVNSSIANNPNMNLTWLIDTQVGLYDVYFNYRIEAGNNPQFKVLANITYIPSQTLGNMANFSGIASETKMVALKILNNTGLGYASDLLSALAWVRDNNTIYNISTVLLSVGNFEMPDKISNIISSQIDSVINNGTMVIIAAGNQGVGSTKLNKLAQNPAAIVVGATNDQDQLTYYSSQGKIINQTVYRPDLVAPGGSLLANHQMVITADTNNGEKNLAAYELVQNDTTSITGTSVAAAVVAGAYNLILEKLGGIWNWDLSIENALYIKSLLLMTASELNTNREDNPITTYDESISSPILNRGTADVYEGYGRINPKAAIDALNNSFIINSSVSIALTASSSNPMKTHVYACNITFEQSQIYRINLTNTGVDSDVYLYETEPDEFGRPIIARSSTQAGIQSEQFYFSNPNATTTYYLVVKAVTGTGTAKLNVSKQICTQPPELSNISLEPSSLTWDILDSYTISVNYTQAENFEPTYVFLHLSDRTENITLIRQTMNPNYTRGVIYSTTLRFITPQMYFFNFSAQTGEFYISLNRGDFYFSVLPVDIKEEINSSNNYFTEFDDTTKWTIPASTGTVNYDGTATLVNTGWNRINTITSNFETRHLSTIGITLWEALYCGAIPSLTPSTPFIRESQPVYTTLGLVGNQDLLSPYFYLNGSNGLKNASVKIASRIGVDTGESFSIEINRNRTGWITLETFTDIQQEWTMLEYNLTDYMNSYIQMRFRGTFLGTGNSQGIILDQFNLTQTYFSNINTPKLLNIAGNQITNQPFYLAGTTKYQRVQFQVMYQDADGNIPQFVNLEIGGNNISMYNIEGKWDSIYTPILDNLNYYYGIVFSCDASLMGIENTSFRFHTFDGKYYTSTAWQSPIQLNNPFSALSFPLTRALSVNEAIESGTPTMVSSSYWMIQDYGWHKVSELKEVVEPEEWYCGIGNYEGYDRNWDTSLITTLIDLNGTNEIFLYFDHQLALRTGGAAAGDYATVSISTNWGQSWTNLITYTQNTGEISSEAIDITTYMGQQAIFRFRFLSGSDGIDGTNGNGWFLSNIRTGINATRDYVKPSVIYVNCVNKQHINSTFVVNILISDNMELNLNKTQFFVDGKILNLNLTQITSWNYTIDTRKYENGKKIELSTIVFDAQGNRAVKKVVFIIDNPKEAWEIYLPWILSISLGLIILFAYLDNKSRKKYASYQDQAVSTSFWDQFLQKRQEAKYHKEEVRAVIANVDRKWERTQPYFIHCKHCKKWFKSNNFDIYCPSCSKDALYIAKKCPVCADWRLFEDEGIHYCKSCKMELLRDYDAALKEVLSKNPHLMESYMENNTTTTEEKEL